MSAISTVQLHVSLTASFAMLSRRVSYPSLVSRKPANISFCSSCSHSQWLFVLTRSAVAKTNISNRSYQTRQPAPSTRRQEKSQKARVLDGTVQTRAQKQEIRDHKTIDRALAMLYKYGTLRQPPSRTAQFLVAFKGLVEKARGELTIPIEAFSQVQKQYDVDDGDCLMLAQIMETATARTSFGDQWTTMFRTLSYKGYLPATLWIMGAVCESIKTTRGALQSSEIRHSYEVLERTARRTDGDYRAKSLLGRIQYFLGNEKEAIELLQDAVQCIGNCKPRASDASRAYPVDLQDPFHLESPYIELALIHQRRKNWEAYERALDIGCQHDDPWSHYFKAVFGRKENMDHEHLATSSWLYHMTKAATSGHPKAMFDLAVFYAESGWKYIEDEPPDHVKPTPFDSYPPTKPTGLLTQLGQLFGILSVPEASPVDDIFRTAIFPTTAQLRYYHAAHWCRLARQSGYAPAALYEAHMTLEKTRWGAASAPASALNLRAERYSAASAADFAAGKRTDPSASPPPADFANTYYDPKHAVECLRDFFLANLAHRWYADTARVVSETERRFGRRPDQHRRERIHVKILADAPPELRRWLAFPDIRESYEAQMPARLAEAQALCDKHGFTIYDDQNRLLYRAKGAKNAGAE